MRQLFDYDINVFQPLIGKVISGFYFIDDFRGYDSHTCYQPFTNQFEGISNLVIWYYKENEHKSLKLYCINNGVFKYTDEHDVEKDSYYGVRSIQTKSNEDLFFGKRGSISLKGKNGFGIEGFGVIQKISFYQEVHQNLKKFDLSKVKPQLISNNCFPDRIVIETENMYSVIRAEEDYDQNLFLKCKVGRLKDSDEYYKSGYDDQEEYEHIKIDEIK
jgi:hypothetical protein